MCKSEQIHTPALRYCILLHNRLQHVKCPKNTFWGKTTKSEMTVPCRLHPTLCILKIQKRDVFFMVLSTSTVVQRLFSISRCGMTHLIKDCSGILQIPHKSPLIKTKPWTAMKRITRQKQYFQVRSHFKLNLLYVSLSGKKKYIPLQYIHAGIPRKQREDGMNCISHCINRSVTLQQVADFSIVFSCIPVKHKVCAQWVGSCVGT